MKKFVYLGLLITCNLLTSCTFHDTPLMESPFIGDQGFSKNVAFYGVTPSRRMVIMSARDNTNDSMLSICAEPPTEVSDNIVNSLATGLQAQASAAGTSGSAAFSMAQSLSPAAQSLLKGVQLYRDGMYSLCQAKMNGAISDTDFSEKMDNLLNQSVKLITAEPPYLSKNQMLN